MEEAAEQTKLAKVLRKKRQSELLEHVMRTQKLKETGKIKKEEKKERKAVKMISELLTIWHWKRTAFELIRSTKMRKHCSSALFNMTQNKYK